MHYFIDLDGVIIDSAHECYEVSANVIYESEEQNYKYKDMFLKYRGLVLDAGEYLILHQTLCKYFENKQCTFSKLYNDLLEKIDKEELIKYADKFFKERDLLISKNENYWLKLNPLTKFGKFLSQQKLNNVIIVTSKNFLPAKKILDHNNIAYIDLFGSESISKEHSKGNLIKRYLDHNKINNAIFIDDSVRNLDTCRDSRVKCFFADWGYGINSTYENYRF